MSRNSAFIHCISPRCVRSCCHRLRGNIPGMKMAAACLVFTGLLCMITCNSVQAQDHKSNHIDEVRLHTPYRKQKGDIPASCNFPPSVWCSSRKIAKICQVEAQCEVWVWRPATVNTTSPVQFTLYLESLCPDCKQFIADTLWPAWKQLHTIMDLHIVPYGNAQEQAVGGEWKFTCQHGPDECMGNLIETCAIHVLQKASSYFPLVHCIEASDDLPVNTAPKCAATLGIDYKPIDACTKSPLGNKLEHKMAVRTQQLQPPHTFVPWVTLNGEHTDEIQEQAMTNLVKLICDTYQGSKPGVCKKQLNVHRTARHEK